MSADFLSFLWPQHVDHVHFHVVPKPSPTEGLVVNMEDNWPIKKVEKEELAKTAEKMILALTENDQQ